MFLNLRYCDSIQCMSKRICLRSTRSNPGILVQGLGIKKNTKRNNNEDPINNIVKFNDMAGGDNNTERVEPTNEQLRAEIFRLRQLNHTQNEQLVALRNQIENSQENGNQLIRTLIDGLKVMNIDAKVPKFEESKNPNQFIERLKKFYSLKAVSDKNKLSFLDGAFEGRARAWFETQKGLMINYIDFKNKFLAEFYSIPIRVQIKSGWLSRRFEGNLSNLQTYFMNQVKEAQYFLPIMEPYELHYTVIQQMPIRVREALATIDYNNFDRISQALSQLDLTYQEKTNHSRQIAKPLNNFGNSNQSNGHCNQSNRQQRTWGSSRKGEGPHQSQRGDKPTSVVNAHLQAYCLSRTQKSYSNFSSPRIPLPDTSRPQPPMIFQTNDTPCSLSSNHSN